MPASTWAKKKGDGGKGETRVSPSASAASAESVGRKSTGGSMSSVSSASGEPFEDDKFHLPVDHQPFMLLPGWDQQPPPPPAPEAPDGGSGSASGGDSEEPASDSGGSSSKPEMPPAPPPPPPGFSCSNCISFKALGNGQFGCESEDYQRWSGTDKLAETKSGRPVVDPTRACSDWYRPATGASAHPVPTRHSVKK